MEETDKQLVVRYSKGQVDALEILIDRYRRQLFGYIIGMTRNQHEADDVFQEVWLRAIKKLARYKHGNLLGWLTRIAHNLVIDRGRKKKPDTILDNPIEEGGTIIDLIPGNESGPEDEMLEAEIRSRIEDAIEELPVEQKEVFLLRVRSKMQFKEIAKIQKVSINTALARMQYALAGLRPFLSEVYDEL
jgi:RNA polymerase sigma-70 factor (ECF subfamily)